MIEWNEQPTIRKDYANTVTYFIKHLAAIEDFETVDGGASNRQGYGSTNTVTKFQTACVAEIKGNTATANKETKVVAMTFTGAIDEQQAEIKSLRESMASTENNMTTREPRTSPHQRHREEV